MDILIQFPDKDTERVALDKLAARFAGHASITGATMVPAPALSFLAEQGLKFTVIGPAAKKSLRDIEPVSVGAVLRPYPGQSDDILGEMLEVEK